MKFIKNSHLLCFFLDSEYNYVFYFNEDIHWMKKRYCLRITAFIIMFQLIATNFVYVEARSNASEQPKVCSWPSKTMSDYFNFQDEAREILLRSEIHSRLYETSFGAWWLFSNKILSLHGPTAIDLIATSIVWNVKSVVSNVVTSTVLLMLASESAFASNLEWLAILFADRPIVRDYRTMLDIETDLFDIAYYNSKQIDLTRPFEWEQISKLNDLIKKYQEKWLFEKTDYKIKGQSSMADILLTLIAMNRAMKQFIMIWSDSNGWALYDFNWCFWSQQQWNCERDVAIAKFSTWAIRQLDEDYIGSRTFGECNLYANSLKSTIKKTINNNSESVHEALQDVKWATERLKNALVGKWRWNLKKPCESLSDYELSQLQAYRGPNWDCKKRVNVSFDVSETKDYSRMKLAQREQKEKKETVLKTAKKPWSKKKIIGNVADKLLEQNTTNGREKIWFKIYWVDESYNPDFSFEQNTEFTTIFATTMDEFEQAQENGMATDISDVFVDGKALLNQIEDTIKKTDELERNLQKIEDVQCEG